MARSVSMMRDNDAAMFIIRLKTALSPDEEARIDYEGALRLNGSRMMLSVGGIQCAVQYETCFRRCIGPRCFAYIGSERPPATTICESVPQSAAEAISGPLQHRGPAMEKG
eukprot:1058980-Pyramimonas_sp.AAC.1